jgi:hypothetical protein
MPIRLLTALILALACTGAAIGKSRDKLLEETLALYASVIRWGNIEQAVEFIDPETLKAHPVSDLDLQRFHQVRVVEYNDQPPRSIGEDRVRQVVEIGLVNNNTQVARSVIDTQVWRWDGKAKRWWLVSGLPDITAPR